MPLRLAFMGTPDFAVPSLSALLAAGHDVAAVYTQPPRPAGRGQKPQESAVQRFAEARGLTVRAPKSLKPPEAQAEFAALGLDVAAVAAYGLILPKPILDAPRHGCINVHASLLPRWRGAAPIARAIMAGDFETGVTIMQMDEGLDTGPILLAERITIGSRRNAGAVHDLLAQLGADLLVRALAALERGTLVATPQPAEGVTYAAKVTKEETRLDWSRPAELLANQVRGLAPHPGAWCMIEGVRVKVLEAEAEEGGGIAGVLLDDHLAVACGAGVLRLTRVQREGRGPMTAQEFLRGHPVRAGTRLSR